MVEMEDCYSELTLRGPSDVLDTFQNVNFYFSKLYPCPAKLTVEWCLEHWGTPYENKKNPDPDAYTIMDSQSDTIIRNRSPNALSLRIWTLQSPPTLFLEYLIKQYPELWIKNLWSIGAKEGVWVGYMENGSITTKTMVW